MKDKYISKIGLVNFLLNFTLFQLLLDLPMLYAKIAYNAVWILSIYIFIIILIYQILTNLMYLRFKKIDIFTISKFALGKHFDKILYFLFFISLFILNIIYVREVSDTIKIIVFDDTKILAISIFYVTAMIISSYCGFDAITRACGYIVPICILFILLLLFFVFPFFRFERLYPLLGSGIKNISIGGLSKINSYIGITFLFFPFIRQIKNINRPAYFYTIISFVLITFTVIANTLIFEYPYTNSNLYALYEMARLTNFNLFFQRAEIIYILVLIFVTFLVLISLFFVTNFCITKIFIKNENRKTVINTILGLIILIIANIPKNIFQIFEYKSTVNLYFTIPILFILPFLILLIATIKSFIKRGEYEKFISNNN